MPIILIQYEDHTLCLTVVVI
uniref:Uncharacterized protein n=1 Tax=Anguilla anguilla TaxID=7936 RepID=A0A0E9S6Q0_ANGAN